MRLLALIAAAVAAATALWSARTAGISQARLADEPAGKIVYEVSQGRRGWLEIAQLDGTARRRLTLPPGRRSDRNDVHATWSPDGRRVAFVRYHGDFSRDALYVINASGRGLRRIGRGGWLPVWSRDGRRLAFAGPAKACNPWIASDVPLFVAAANGSRLRRLSVFPRTTKQTFADAADWSPNAQTLLYTVPQYNGNDCLQTSQIRTALYRIRSDGKRRTRVRDGDIGQAQWSRDARRIAFTDGSVNRCEVFVSGPSGRPARRLVEVPWVEEGCFDATDVFAWLPSGREIVVGEAMSVAAYDVETGSRRLIAETSRTRCSSADYPCETRIVAVSGDGRYLAVHERPNDSADIGIPGRLYVVSSDGTKQWELPYPRRRQTFAVFLNRSA